MQARHVHVDYHASTPKDVPRTPAHPPPPNTFTVSSDVVDPDADDAY